jgi:signal transduction histidine kinase
MLSHELRNPLAPIRNSIWILRHGTGAPEQVDRAQRVIERQTEHLTRLVDDLLDVTRIARGRIELRRARVDLAEVVARAAEDFRTVMRDREVAFDVALPSGRLWAEADPTRVTQIVGNLLHNASKFTRRGDAVSLSLAESGGAAVLRVRDTGAGIEPALLPAVFEPFVQGERTLARTEGGLGLGLALVKAIAELHGGSARADSAGKGQGAEFVVTLPLAVALPAP